METFSLFNLNEYIRRVVALNFQDSVWITAEISQIKLSKGHYYLDLIEKDSESNQIIAQASGIIWAKTSFFLKRKLKQLFDAILDTGNEVRIKINVDFHERFGLKLEIVDLDAGYSLGKAEIQRQEIIERLTREELVDVNARINLPVVIQRIAIISSEKAAGYKDFISHLQSNVFDYEYNLELFDSAVQGSKLEKEVISALESIQRRAGEFDIVAIIRGGGSRLDLAGFDNYEVAKKIAQFPIPIISGIGHEIDHSIVDLVAHTSLKTPTAVADFLIDRNLAFESELNDLLIQIKNRAQKSFREKQLELNSITERLYARSRSLLKEFIGSIDEFYLRLKFLTLKQIQDQDQKLKILSTKIDLLKPEKILKRGFALISKNGKIQNTIKKLFPGDSIEVTMMDGKVNAQIEGKK